MKITTLLLAILALFGACFFAGGCNPAANEAEDVQEAREELQEEKADAAAED